MYRAMITLILIFISITNLNAGEIKFNLPVAAYHTKDRVDGGKWNEFFLDDVAFGGSYKNDKGLGFSINQSINSYGNNRSFYVTADYLPTVVEDGIFKLNVGGHLGIATGYDQLSRSGVIPFLGAGVEVEVSNFSLEGIVTPQYKTAPTTFILLAKFKLWDSDQGSSF